MSHLERVWYQTTNATKGLPYSPVNLTPTGSIHASTIGALVGGNRNLSQGWGTSPQLNWRLPTNATKGHNATKAKKSSSVQEGQAPMSNSNQILRGEHKPMHQMQMARTPQRCSNPSLPNSTKATKAYGGIREEEQWRKSTKDSKI